MEHGGSIMAEFESKLYGKGLFWNDGHIVTASDLQFVKCPICFGKMVAGNNTCSWKCYKELEVNYAVSGVVVK